MQAAMATPLPDLFLYTRNGCHLCVETRAIVQSLLEDRAARGQRTAALRERDIATDPDWERRFFATIPVVELAGRRSQPPRGTVLEQALDDCAGLDAQMAAVAGVQEQVGEGSRHRSLHSRSGASGPSRVADADVRPGR